jgi:hypothetical protein
MKGINPNSVRIIRDNVLIKLKPVNDKVIFSNGKELLIDHTFNPASHQNVIAEVVKLPEKFTKPSPESKKEGIEWLPQLDLKIGDKVIVDYFLVLQNFGKLVHRYIDKPNEMYLEWKGEYYVFVPYHEIFTRLDPIVPLNGWVIYEGIHKEVNALKYKKTYLEVNRGIVKYVGKKNLEYVDDKSDVDGLAPGDEIVFKKGMYRKLENDVHATLDKNLYLVQRRYVQAIVKNRESKANSENPDTP